MNMFRTSYFALYSKVLSLEVKTCTSMIIKKRPQSVSFIERLLLLLFVCPLLEVLLYSRPPDKRKTLSTPRWTKTVAALGAILSLSSYRMMMCPGLFLCDNTPVKVITSYIHYGD